MSSDYSDCEDYENENENEIDIEFEIENNYCTEIDNEYENEHERVFGCIGNRTIIENKTISNVDECSEIKKQGFCLEEESYL